MSACPFTPAVVARHLDGDVEAARAVPAALGWQSTDALAEHLGECSACRRELQRSRKLDAVLAEASGRACSDLVGDGERLDRLVQRALAAANPRPVGAPSGPVGVRRAQRLALTLVLLASGATIARLWPMPTAPELSLTPPTAHEATATATPAADAARRDRGISLGPGAPLSPVSAAIFVAPRSPREITALCAILTDRALADRLLLTTALGTSTTRCLPQADISTTTAVTLRVRASTLLLEASSAAAFAGWTRATASLEGGPVLERALALARRRADLAAWLSQRLRAVVTSPDRSLDDLAVVTTAARVGGRDVDAALRALLRRADLHHELCAAMRTVRDRPGRTALLLDAFADLQAGGRGDVEHQARMLFAGQPSAVTADLQRELQRTREQPQRIRCLLALGMLGGDAAATELLAAIAGKTQPESMAAAFALSLLPLEQLDLAVSLATHRRCGWLVRAALCRARWPAAADFVTALELSPAERTLLRAGGSTFDQFPTFAHLLREHGAHLLREHGARGL